MTFMDLVKSKRVWVVLVSAGAMVASHYVPLPPEVSTLAANEVISAITGVLILLTKMRDANKAAEVPK